jgi:hypothetical protein
MILAGQVKGGRLSRIEYTRARHVNGSAKTLLAVASKVQRIAVVIARAQKREQLTLSQFKTGPLVAAFTGDQRPCPFVLAKCQSISANFLGSAFSNNLTSVVSIVMNFLPS